ncbi:MAG: dienelactone hydrolase family protein [Thermoanaerobaculia bacterium]
MKTFRARSPLLGVALATASLAAIACTASDEAHVEAMELEHASDEPVASPAAEIEPRGEITSTEVHYATLGHGGDGEDGVDVNGYLAQPVGEAEARPAVILIHEWWGLNDNIRAVADRFAGEGYLALAVDLYEGQVAGDREGAATLMRATLEKTDRLNDNLKQARAFLADQGAGKVGSVGWCFGGGWSLNAAIHLGAELEAAIIYYGRVTDDPQRLSRVAAPVLGLFGGQDRGIPVESVRAFETAMTELRKSIEVHVYEDANHAFANPSGTRYNEAAATDAWAKTLAFFAEHLR